MLTSAKDDAVAATQFDKFIIRLMGATFAGILFPLFPCRTRSHRLHPPRSRIVGLSSACQVLPEAVVVSVALMAAQMDVAEGTQPVVAD